MVLVRTADLEEVVVRNLVLICIKENLGSTAAGFHHIRFLKYLYSKYNRYAICLIEMSFSTSEIAGNFAIDITNITENSEAIISSLSSLIIKNYQLLYSFGLSETFFLFF